MKYEYLKGSAKDFEGAPEWAIYLAKLPGHGCSAWISGGDDHYRYVGSGREFKGIFLSVSWLGGMNLIAERRPITDESDLNECIGQPLSDFGAVKDEDFIDDFVTFGKYDRQCKGVTIDVYDVLQAFEVVNPALQHLIKKALCAGLRGHKKREQDLVEILESAKRAIELEGVK